jgi:cytochrome c peroxidase
MKMRIKLVPVVLGVLVVLGIPPVLLLTAFTQSAEIAAVETPKDPLRALVAQESNLERFYIGWQKGYLARGGDRNVDIPVAWWNALSTEQRSKARGRVHLNLIDGIVRAEVYGLDGPPVDLWLVDNQEGPGMTVQPQPGDRMVRVGRLQADGAVARMAGHVGADFFRDFELDLAVISRAGRTPAESAILLGSRDYFERLYTQTRIAAEKTRARNAKLFGPASLLALLSPRLAEANSTQILISHGLVGQAVGNGADLFFLGQFSGNGRTCATCHRVENNQGLDLDFIATLPPDDKLFVAEFPPSQGGVPGLERPLLMRGHALILENVDGLENPTQKFTMRGVPHSLSLATSILAPPDGRAPVQRTGWSGDGAPGNGALRLFPTGAVNQHFPKSLNRINGTDFVLPTDSQLDQMQAFMLASGRLNELNLASVTLTNAGAQAGKLRFVQADARCNGCHANAGANIANGQNFNFNTGVERAPDPSQATEAHPRDGGFGAAVVPNFDCDGNGSLDCFGDGTFNTPPLIEAADTEPFFHNNNAATVEDSVRFFTTSAFANSPAGGGTPVPLSEADIQNIAAFLRVINASFNTAISIQRNNAALSLENGSEDSGGVDSLASGGGAINGKRATVNELLRLSNVEANDAKTVLVARSLHADAVTLLNSAISKNNQAILENGSQRRQALIQSALTDLNAAKAKFGTGLNFTLGEGNLLFPQISDGGSLEETF